ncbi:hypothetical protein ACFL5S_00020 [Fibrobacterota bacterium]
MRRQRKYDVWNDAKANRMYLILNGFFSFWEIRDIKHTIINETKKLSSGFQAIWDITQLRPLPIKNADELKQALSYMKDYGLEKIILVADFSLMSYVQLSQVLKEIGYKAEFADTVEDAKKMLEE